MIGSIVQSVVTYSGQVEPKILISAPTAARICEVIMMRLIDTDALLDSFDVHWVTEYDEAGFSMEYKAVPVGAIEDAPTIDAMPKWISVEDKRPKRGEYVLFLYAKDAQNPVLHAKNPMVVGRYEYGMYLANGCAVKVTHWMPLPEPPEVDT